MRKIAAVIVIVLFLAAGTLTAARAAWSGTVTSGTNYVTSGTADLQVTTQSLSLNNLIPGSTARDGGQLFTLKNRSTAAITFILAGQITPATVIAGSPDKGKFLLQIYDYDNPAEASALTNLSDWEAGAVDFNSTLAAGSEKKYGIKAQLETTADSSWEGKTVSFTIKITGTQQ